MVVLVDLMGFGIVLPLLPFYASHFNAGPVQVGLLYSVYSFCQLVASPFWGSLSDRIGRKPVMLVSTLGACAAYLLFAFSGSFAMIFLSRLVAGTMGGNISTAQAYIADVTTPDRRAKGMGLLGAAFGIGFALGPAIASLLIHSSLARAFEHAGMPGAAVFLDQNKYALPGFFAAGLSFLSAALVFFCLPEPAKAGESDAVRVKRYSIFSKEFWSAAGGATLPLLMAALFTLSFGQSSLYSSFPLFCKTALSMSAEAVGMQFAFMGLIAVVIQGGLIRPLEKRFGERRLFIVGCALMAAGFAMIPLARSQGTLMATLAVMGIGGSLNGPTLNSLISKKAVPGRVGAAMGSAQGISALGRVIGPTWGGFLFAFSTVAPFWVTSAVICFTIFIGISLKDPH